MNIFEENDYRPALRNELERKKEEFGKPWTFQAMAQSCRVHKPYLSKVLSGDGHLSADQVYRAALYLKCSRKEREFLLLLREWDQSVISERRAELKLQIDRMRKEASKTEAHIEVSQLSTVPDAQIDYYLDPDMQVVHMFLTVTRYANDPEKIAAELGLPLVRIQSILGKLTAIGLIQFKKGRYEILKDDLHLSKDSPLYRSYQSAMRNRLTENMRREGDPDGYGFSVIFSATDDVRSGLMKDFLDLLSRAQKSVGKSQQQEVFGMDFSLTKFSS